MWSVGIREKSYLRHQREANATALRTLREGRRAAQTKARVIAGGQDIFQSVDAARESGHIDTSRRTRAKKRVVDMRSRVCRKVAEMRAE